MSYQIEDVFSPRSFPENTYIARKLEDEETLDERLKRALSMKGNLIFVSGASKSGKTVLCHKVIDKDAYIALSGNQISSKADFWNHIAEQLAMTAGRTERQIIKYLIDNNKVLVIDDFHYIEQQLQLYIARTLKTELFNGLKAVIISLPHRSDEAIICNPDLIGRTTSIEIAPWTVEELKEIAEKGFSLLALKIGEAEKALLAQESITSPQLMQENCFQLAFLAQRKKQPINLILVQDAFKQTAKNYAHYEQLVAAMAQGPMQGVGRRKLYELADGSADIYQLMLLALKADPPVTALGLPALKKRISVLLHNGEVLSSSLLSATINKIIKLVAASLPELDALEYKNQCLYILDPFLLFYLRWK